MKKVVISLFLMFCFVVPGWADVYYAPGPVYVKPDPGYQAAQGIGALLGALIQGANQQKAQAEQAKIIKDAQDRINKLASEEATSMSNNIFQHGLDATWNGLDNALYSMGLTPQKNISGGIAVMTTAQNLEGGVRFLREYSINMNTSQVRCIVEVLPIGLRAVSVAKYTLPQPQIQPQAAAPATTATVAAGDHLGIVMSTEKTAEGWFTVQRVTSGGLCDFAGVKPGDILTKLDTYDLKEFDLERISAYVELRRKQSAVIKATILRDGQPIVVEMQL